MTEYTVALWYYRYSSPDYDLFETETEAADFGTFLEDRGEGSVTGAQFADGRVVKCGKWDAYREAQRRRRDEYERASAERESAPPVPGARSP